MGPKNVASLIYIRPAANVAPASARWLAIDFVPARGPLKRRRTLTIFALCSGRYVRAINFYFLPGDPTAQLGTV